MHAGREGTVLAALVALGLALRIALALVVPPGQAPDEMAHGRYVAHVAATGTLPVQPVAKETPGEWSTFAGGDPGWQSYQPPLAYLLYVPVWRALEAAGVGEAGRIRGLRLQSACWGAVLVAVGWAAVARLTAAGDPRRVLVALVLALVPGFAGNAAVVNNDGVANLLAAALWLPLGAGRGVRAALAAGALFGGAMLAKLTVLALAPLLVVVPWLRGRELRAALRDGTLAAVVAGVLLLPWMARNVAIYGHPLAIGVGSIAVAGLADVLPPEVLAAFARPAPERAFVQFWGAFGVYNNVTWPVGQWVLTAAAALALAGLFRARPDVGAPMLERLLPALGLAVVLAACGLAIFSLRYLAGWQGRYLYTVTLPVAVLLATGWTRATPPRWRPAFALALGIGLLVLDAGLVLKLAAFFARTPPARWPFEATL
jgi:hypothetical protein